jgi:hypothetical protein
VTSSEKKLYATADGGNTWKSIVATPGEWLRFAEPGTGWSFGREHLAFSTNGGGRWTSRPHRFPATVKALSFPRRDRAYVVGEHGMVFRYRVLDPAEKTTSGALAAPAMPPFATPLEGEAAEALALLESLGAAGGSPAAAAEGRRDEVAAEESAVEDQDVVATAAAEDEEYSEDVEEEPAAAGAAAIAVPGIAPAKLGKLDLVITALGTTVPSFLSHFTNLNLFAARLRSAGELPARLSELKAALSAVKKAADKSAADAALAQALTAAQGLYAAAAVATQRQLPAVQAGQPSEVPVDQAEEESVEESAEAAEAETDEE